MKNKLRLAVLFLFLGLGIVVAQTTRVTGTILSGEDGLPVLGASIILKGGSSGVTSDVDGHFTIDLPVGTKVLQISYVGMATQEIAVKPTVSVVLHADTKLLEEVIIVAYGTTKRSSFTGSASAIDGDKLSSARVESVDKALNGKLSGVRVTSLTGDPGASGDVQIRGVGSITGLTTPLYVIDGIPITTGSFGEKISGNTLSSINPEDIASMTVLKDAAAASLYGSRAANGVIVITTKRGRVGKTRFNFKVNSGWSNMATNSYEVMTANEYLDYFRDALVGKSLYVNNAIFPGSANYRKEEILKKAEEYADENLLLDHGSPVKSRTRGADWRRLIYEGGYQREALFSAAGGDEKSKLFTSLGYNKVRGLVKYREFERVSFLLNLENKPRKWLELSFKNQMSYSTQLGRGDQSDQKQGLATAGPLSMLFSSLPDQKLYNEDGTYNLNSSLKSKVKNAIWGLSPERQFVTNNTIRLINNVGAKLIFSDWLSFRSNNSIDFFEVKSFNYWSPESVDGASQNGLGEKASQAVTMITSSNLLDFHQTVVENHQLDALIGTEMQRFVKNKTFLSVSDYSNDRLKELSSGQAKSATSDLYENFMISFLGNLNYSYKNKYYLSGSLRSDRSSKLGVNRRQGLFWSGSASWRFSEEPFLKNDFLSDGKVRFSYGTNGTLPLLSFSYMGLYNFGGNYADKPASYLDQLENMDLAWETSRNMNVGVDFTFSKRFSISVEYFDKYTKDLLMEFPISYYTGGEFITLNNGDISNKGVEFEFHASNMLNAELVWSADITFAKLKATVERLPEGDIIAGDGDLYLYREKEDLYSFYLPTWLGVDPECGLGLFLIDPNLPDTPDNRTFFHSKAKRTIQKSAYPKINGGVGNTFSYKGLTASFLLTYQFGGTLFDYPSYFQVNDGMRLLTFNPSREVAGNYWKERGDIVENPRPIFDYQGAIRSDKWSTRQLHSTDFLRFKELSLSYHLPSTWYKTLGVSSVDVSFVANNLCYLYAATKNRELEVALNGYRTADTPMARTYAFGLNVGF